MENIVRQEIHLTSRDNVPWGRFVALFPQHSQLLTMLTAQGVTQMEFPNSAQGYEAFNALMLFLTPPEQRRYLQSSLPAVEVVK